MTNLQLQNQNQPLSLNDIELYIKDNSIAYYIFHNQTENLKKAILKDKNIINEIDGNASTTYTWTPLYWCVKLRRIECLKILLEFGADINIVVNDSLECCGTVLDLATLRNDAEIQKILRDHASSRDVDLSQSFRAIRTKLRGKTQSFDFRSNRNRV